LNTSWGETSSGELMKVEKRPETTHRLTANCDTGVRHLNFNLYSVKFGAPQNLALV